MIWFLDFAKLVQLVIKAAAGERRSGPAERGPGRDPGPQGPQVGRRLLHPRDRKLRQPEQDLVPRAQAGPGPAQDLLVPAGGPAARVVGPRDRRLLPDDQLGPRQRLRGDQRGRQQLPARHAQHPRAAVGRPQRRPTAQFPEGLIRAARQSDYPGHRLQEADQGGQPAISWASPWTIPVRSRTR